MKYCPQITIAAAILAFSTGGWVRNSALSVGVVSGAIAIFQLKPVQKSKLDGLLLQEQEISDRIHSLEKQLTEKQTELAELDHLTTEELERLSHQKQEQVAVLNRQIEDLQALLEEQLIEIDQREAQSRERLRCEMNEYRAVIEAELEAKQKQLGAIAQDDEAWLEQETQRLTQMLEADKAAFLETHKAECDRLNDRIEFLEQELIALQWQLRDYNSPQMPDGVEQDAIVSRRVIEILHKLGVTCDYRGSWLDTSYIYVRIRPRIGGLKQVTKYLDRLMIELALAEKPQAELVPGAVQLYLRPRSFLPVEPTGETFAPVRVAQHPETVEQGAIATLNASYLKDFAEPEMKHSINGNLSQLEIDWVNWLWNFHEPRPIRNQKAIIYRIWGKKSGDGMGFMTARSRLHRIAQILKIELRRKNDGGI